MAALVEALAAEQVEWLADRLRNEPSLKQRLMQLVHHLGPDVVGPVVPRPNRWATAAKDTRNVLVHRFDVGHSEEPPSGPVMYALAELTSAVITLILLQEIGLTREQLVRLASEHQAFRWVRRRAKEYVPRIFDVTD